ncbi:putative glycolipid-binding domain-containing protein [Shouchella patagoniensis]|uniref:putative glycolipid-binding domain-containing protein n=1 Tax=Shouchella patagoniensis TaxID=228576 RepID=UPI000994F531|nr:putative glycolipid-binding domain-containing protein [Shouchella patagoniensis]
MKKTILWKNEERVGYEHFLMEENKGIGTIIYVDDEKGHVVNYELKMEPNWLTRQLFVQVDHGKTLTLVSDGNGEWLNKDGQPLDDLKGAIDVDVESTPFSNTLPINRKIWKVGEKKTFDMVHVTIPELNVSKVKQIYTYEREEEGLRYFEYECRGYKNVICVDEDGFVVHYPNVFSRWMPEIREKTN